MPRPRKYPTKYTNRYGKVTVYRTKSGNYTSYRVVWQEGSSRKKVSSSNEDHAHTRAQEILNDLAATGSSRPDSSSSDWTYFRRCQDKLPEGVELHEAVDWYLSNGPGQQAPKAVADVISEFIRSRETTGKSDRYLDTLRCNLYKIDDLLGHSIWSVDAAQLDDVLQKISDPRTRFNIRSSLVSCWKWAVTKGWLPHGVPTAAERTDCPTLPAKDPEIITPTQLRDALSVAAKCYKLREIVPYLAIAAFAGVRSAEICRMTWEKNVDLSSGILILGSDITKTKRRRIVPMEANLQAWLNAYESEGPVCPPKPHRLLAQTHTDEWPHNALRHSAVSYLMAEHQNAAVVAERCGHTESQLQTSYKANVTPDEAKEWWSINPQISH